MPWAASKQPMEHSIGDDVACVRPRSGRSASAAANSAAAASAGTASNQPTTRQIGDNARMRTILVVDDNPAVVTALDVLFSLREIRTLRAASPEEGLAVLERERVDLVVQDMNFRADTTSGEEGVALFRALRERCPDLPVILLTAWTHLPTAVELVKAGAADYLSKPWDDAKLLATVENLLELSESGAEVRRARSEGRVRKEALATRYALQGLVFEADATLRALELACQVARSDVPVLVTG